LPPVVLPVVDGEAPVITLLGDAVISIHEGELFNDLGASAIDNIDGDLSTRIVVSNPLNTALSGVYQITYNVSDAAGNAAMPVSREVTVLAQPTSIQAPVASDPTAVSGSGDPVTVDKPSTSSGGGGGGSLAWSWLLMLWLLACRVGMGSCRRAL